MRNAWVLLVAGVSIGVAATLAIDRGLLSPQPSPPPPADGARDDPTTSPVGASSLPDGERLAAIEERLERIQASIAGLDQKLEAALNRPERVPARDPSATAIVDEDSLVRALQRVEEDRLAALSADGLLSEARALRDKNDLDGAQRALELLLDRSLEPMPRARALTELGMLHRRGRDFAAAAQTLEEAMNTVGFNCPEGAWAGYHLMWTRKDQGRQADALVLADAIAGSTVSNASIRMHGRWVAASLSHDLGNLARARADYDAILAECGEVAEYRHIVEDVRRRRNRLR